MRIGDGGVEVSIEKPPPGQRCGLVMSKRLNGFDPQFRDAAAAGNFGGERLLPFMGVARFVEQRLSHPEDSKSAPLPLIVSQSSRGQGGPQSLPQHTPGMCRWDDAIIPQPRRREHRVTFSLYPVFQLWVDGFTNSFHHRR